MGREKEATGDALPLRHVAAVVVGNALGFYDFVTYSFFAVYIGRAFFPAKSAGVSLLLSLVTFGLGFLTRPLGAVVIGGLGDRVGRKPAMLLSFALMGVGIVGLALTPPYAAIGIAAPILVVTFRLLQGLALGGEVGPTTAYMVEAAPPLRRGLYASMQAVSQDFAALVAGIIATSLASVLGAGALQDWGWRVTMLLGAAIIPFGLALRRSLPETLHAAHDAALAPDTAALDPPPRARLEPYLLLIVLGLLILTAGTIGNYISNFMTTYALTTLRMQATAAFGVLIVNGVFSVAFDYASGVLSDRFGRKPVMIVPGIVLFLSIVPAFLIITSSRSAFALYAAMAWLSTMAALSSGPVLVALTETLPPSVRSGAVATVYAVAISVFGGSAQPLVEWLLQRTRDPLIPAYYWSAALLVALVAMALMKESAPAKVGVTGEIRNRLR